jgi:hypothetical protein
LIPGRIGWTMRFRNKRGQSRRKTGMRERGVEQ